MNDSELQYEPVEAKPAAPSKPTRVEEADLLRIENLTLRLSNNQLRHTQLLGEIHKAKLEQVEIVQAMEKFRGEALEKYGVDIYTHQTGPDGTFYPAPTPGT